MSKLHARSRQQHGVDLSPGRRALRRQKLTNMLSDLRAKEFLNLGLHRGDLDVLDEDKQMMLVMSRNTADVAAAVNTDAGAGAVAGAVASTAAAALKSPAGVYRGARAARAAPRQLSVYDSPVALSREHQRLLGTRDPLPLRSSAWGYTEGAHELPYTNHDLHRQTPGQGQAGAPPRADPTTTANTTVDNNASASSDNLSEESASPFGTSPAGGAHATAAAAPTKRSDTPTSISPSLPRANDDPDTLSRVLEKGAKQRVTALNSLRLDWAGHIEKTEHGLHERQSELQRYESKLASEALRLRHSSEQVKYQFDDMQAQSESIAKIRAELDAARHTLALRQHDLDARERQLEVRTQDFSVTMAKSEARESEMRAYQAKLAEIAAETNRAATEARERDSSAQQAHNARMGELVAEESRLRTAAEHVSGIAKEAEAQRAALERREAVVEARERVCIEKEESHRSVAAEVLATQRAVRQNLAALMLTQQQLIREAAPPAERDAATAVRDDAVSNYYETASFTDVLIAHDRTLRAVNSHIDAKFLSVRECEGSTSVSVAKLHEEQALHRDRAARLETLGAAVEAQSVALRQKEQELAERETMLQGTVKDCRSLGERLERRERHVQETIASLTSREEHVQTAESALRESEAELRTGRAELGIEKKRLETELAMEAARERERVSRANAQVLAQKEQHDSIMEQSRLALAGEKERFAEEKQSWAQEKEREEARFEERKEEMEEEVRTLRDERDSLMKQVKEQEQQVAAIQKQTVLAETSLQSAQQEHHSLQHGTAEEMRVLDEMSKKIEAEREVLERLRLMHEDSVRSTGAAFAAKEAQLNIDMGRAIKDKEEQFAAERKTLEEEIASLEREKEEHVRERERWSADRLNNSSVQAQLNQAQARMKERENQIIMQEKDVGNRELELKDKEALLQQSLRALAEREATAGERMRLQGRLALMEQDVNDSLDAPSESSNDRGANNGGLSLSPRSSPRSPPRSPTRSPRRQPRGLGTPSTVATSSAAATATVKEITVPPRTSEAVDVVLESERLALAAGCARLEAETLALRQEESALETRKAELSSWEEVSRQDLKQAQADVTAKDAALTLREESLKSAAARAAKAEKLAELSQETAQALLASTKEQQERSEAAAKELFERGERERKERLGKLDRRQSAMDDLERTTARRELACADKEAELRAAEEDIRAALGRVQHRETEMEAATRKLDERDRVTAELLETIEARESKIQGDQEVWLREAQQRERQTAETLQLETAEQEARMRDDIERERIAMERELKEEVRAELHRRKEELSLSVSKRVALKAEEEAKKQVAAAVQAAREEEERAILLRSKNAALDILETKRAREEQWTRDEQRLAREKEAWTKRMNSEKLEMSRLVEQQRGSSSVGVFATAASVVFCRSVVCYYYRFRVSFFFCCFQHMADHTILLLPPLTPTLILTKLYRNPTWYAFTLLTLLIQKLLTRHFTNKTTSTDFFGSQPRKRVPWRPSKCKWRSSRL
jgi:hypothetical protein